MDDTIDFAQAMLHLLVAGGLWCGAALYVVRTSPRRPDALRDALAVAIVLGVLAWLLGPALRLTGDSTNDLALALQCARDDRCPTLGVAASHGGYEGGVLWTWTLAGLMSISESPRFLLLAFVAIHAGTAALVTMTSEHRRAALTAGAVTFVFNYALAPGYIAWHPTLAPAAAVPFVLVACRMLSDRGRTDSSLRTLGYLLGGSAYAVSLGYYIASLFLFPVVGLMALRGRWADRGALVVGFVVTQVLVAPHAALHNTRSIELDAVGMFTVALVVGVSARRKLLAWAARRPALVCAASVVLIITLGAVVAGKVIFPFYPALLAALFGVWTLEVFESRRPRLDAVALGATLTVLVVGSSVAFSFLTDKFHEGHFVFQDIYDIGSSYRGGYGASRTSPSYILEYSFRLWGDAAETDERLGVAIVTPEDAPGALCDASFDRADDLAICEYASWIEGAGATLCDLRHASERCRTFETDADFDLSLVRSPFHFNGNGSHLPLVEGTVRVCPEPGAPRVLRPLVFIGLPGLRGVEVREVPSGWEVADDRSAVTVPGGDGACMPLVFHWDADRERLADWYDAPLERDPFEDMVFLIEEQRAYPRGQRDASPPP